MELPERIEHKVFKTSCGCWLWLGYLIRRGYGRVSLDGKMKLAHRVVYEILHGPIPPGLECDHLCRVRACVNPDHIEPVTPSENAKRGLVGLNPNSHAHNVNKIHCPYGHPYNYSNTYITRGGKRQCRTCKRMYWRKRSV